MCIAITMGDSSGVGPEIILQSFAKAELTGPDKLTSTDGVYGIRVTHNLELTVTGFGKK